MTNNTSKPGEDQAPGGPTAEQALEADTRASDALHPSNTEDAKNIKTAPTQPDTSVGKDTVGVGQPTAQAVTQGGSLPPAPVPVERSFGGQPADQFYDPMDEERANRERDARNSGAPKTEDLDDQA